MSGAAELARRIGERAGADIARTGESVCEAYRLDDVAPQAVAFADTAEQVAAVLGTAHERGWGVVPWGRGSTVACGDAPARYDVALVTTGMGHLLEHDPDNLTLIGEAGLTVSEANRQIAAHHQFLALDFPSGEHTLGGLVAANRGSAKRLRYGDLRDQLLGVRVALPDGQLVRYGRKVIKNVAGYDMNKLFLGSHGMLGVVVEVTLKLSAVPDGVRYLMAGFPDVTAGGAAAGALFRSALQPSSLLLLSGEAVRHFAEAQPDAPRQGDAMLLAGFEGRVAGLERQITEATAAIAVHGARGVGETAEIAEAARACLASPGAEVAESGTVVRLRAGMPPAATGRHLAAMQRAAAEQGLGLSAVTDCSGAVAHLAVAVPDAAALERLAGLVPAWRDLVHEHGGFVAVESAPPAFKQHVSAWGDLGGEAAVMRTIKRRFDPNGVLAPGRFLG